MVAKTGAVELPKLLKRGRGCENLPPSLWALAYLDLEENTE